MTNIGITGTAYKNYHALWNLRHKTNNAGLANKHIIKIFHTKNGNTIRREIAPNGDHLTELLSGNEVIKTIEKSLNNGFSVVDTWNYLTGKGKRITKVKTESGDCLQKVTAKTSPNIAGDAWILTRYKKGLKLRDYDKVHMPLTREELCATESLYATKLFEEFHALTKKN